MRTRVLLVNGAPLHTPFTGAALLLVVEKRTPRPHQGRGSASSSYLARTTRYVGGPGVPPSPRR